MDKLIECVPNFSEGRNPQIIEHIIASMGNVFILGKELDPDHNRSVVTFAATPCQVVDAAFQAIATATAMIDINKHTGEHPRIGVTDVCPFIPLKNTNMQECVELSHKLGQRVAKELKIPVFLYEEAATKPQRHNLAHIRKGSLKNLQQKMTTEPNWAPDYGPKEVHPTAGAIAIGARFFLIAFNVNLASNDIQIAKKIASKIRQRDGGLPKVKALGISLVSRNLVQVSMNLTDHRVTSMDKVFEAISAQAKEENVEVLESELIGLAPKEAFAQITAKYLKIRDFRSEQIIENKLQLIQKDPLVAPNSFLQTLASSTSSAGGGSASALCGAIAAALTQMVTKITAKKLSNAELEQKVPDIQKLQQTLFELIKEDAEVYGFYVQARKMPKETKEEKKKRHEALEQAKLNCVFIPLEISKCSLQIMQILSLLVEKANAFIISDVAIAAHMAYAALLGGILTIKVNLPKVKNEKFIAQIKMEIKDIVNQGEVIKTQIAGEVDTVLDDFNGDLNSETKATM